VLFRVFDSAKNAVPFLIAVLFPAIPKDGIWYVTIKTSHRSESFLDFVIVWPLESIN
jgi:hypothetical protein